MIAAGRRRFWKEASARLGDEGWEILLDARVLSTPAKAALLIPAEALAQEIVGEWNAQGKEVVPQSMPMTRSANSAIDKVGRNRPDIISMLADYGDSDLLCYRAGEPAALRARQDVAWQPWLDWADRRFDASMNVMTGLVHRPQPDGSLARLKAQVGRFDNFGLTALHDLVAISGSLVLGLAVALDELGAEKAFTLSRLDEHWQAGQWGRDDEAEAAETAKLTDFLNAWRFLNLSRNRTTPA